MKLTLKQLAQYCAAFDVVAEIDGDGKRATVYQIALDSRGRACDHIPVNVIWLK